MIKAYEYLFYRLYKWNTKVDQAYEDHKYNAILMVSSVLMINVFTVPIVFQILYGMKFKLPDIPEYVFILLGIILLILNYLYFNYDNRYLNILERYKHETTVSEEKGNIIVVVYIIGSYLLLITSGLLGIYLRS